MNRRYSSKNFRVRAKSPHILDLSSGDIAPDFFTNTIGAFYSYDPSIKRRKKPKNFRPKIVKKIIEKDDVFRDLQAIENRDAMLASSIRAPASPEELKKPGKKDYSLIPHKKEDSFAEQELKAFFESEKHRKPKRDSDIHISSNKNSLAKSLKGISGFVFVSSLFTAIVFGAFFVQKIGNAEEGAETHVTDESIKGVSNFSFALEAIRSFDFGGIPGLSSKIPSLLGLIGAAKDFYGIAPTVFGYGEPKRYFIAFQNSSELRPTGGFIGSYAIAEISEGVLSDILVDGIYNADGQLTVNVVPPKPFQHITTAWSTHDANWFLDFPTSAEKIIWFYEKTGGGKMDGVITLNVSVVEKLLAITGPISLPEYDLIVDSENFRDEIQYEVEVAYDKELNRPKKVLADFTPIFFEKLSAALEISIQEIMTVLMESLEDKSIMLYAKDANVQDFFEKQGWSGKIKDVSCQSSVANCSRSDYLAVVHSNLGGYKTSKYMDDEIEYSVEIMEDGSIVGSLTIKRTHNGGDTQYWWYNRKNIDYIKIYVPQGVEILSYEGGVRREPEALVDYEALGFTKDADVVAIESGSSILGPIDIFKETDKTVFGTWLVTSPKKTTEFTIRYKLPFRIKFANEIAKYTIYFQKQPGTSVKSGFDISYPDFWDVVWSTSPDTTEGFVLDKDKVVGYIFEKIVDEAQ